MTLRIAVAGTHSTGKSTLMSKVEEAATARGHRVVRIGDIAREAREIGFPILKDHTADSTLWIMAECLRREAAASLEHDVILVDRPPIDALGYLAAALETTGREIPEELMLRLERIASSDAGYDVLVVTVLDTAVPTGEGRDPDEAYRVLAGRKIREMVDRMVPRAWPMSSADADDVAARIIDRL